MHSLKPHALALLLCAFLAACGDSNDGNGSGGGNGSGLEPPADLEESLNMLGVETATTDRLDSQGNPFPETYAPLGNIIYVSEMPPVESEASPASASFASPASASFASPAATDEPTYTLGRREELFLGGLRLEQRNFVFSTIDDISLMGLTEQQAELLEPEPAGDELPDDNGVIRVLEGRSDAPEWAQETFANVDTQGTSVGDKVPLGTRRSAVAADINGDGFQDAVVAYADDDLLGLQIVDGDDSTAILDFSLLAGGRFLPAYDVQISAGDFDGDGTDELAIGIARQPEDGVFDTPVGLYIVDDAAANFAVIDEYDLTPDASFDRSYITLDVESYHADHDNKDEIAMVVNEAQRFAQDPGNYASRFFVFALTPDGVEELAAKPITADVLTADGTKRSATAVIASLATDDIDNDSIDELILAGFEEVIENCKSDSSPDAFIKYVLFAFGGRFNDFEPIAAGASEVATPPCRFDSGAKAFKMRHASINVLDFDGDGDADIQLNDLIFDFLPPNDWENSLLAKLPDGLIYSDFSDERSFYDRNDIVIVVSDQTGDGVEDIVSLDTYNSDGLIKIWSWDKSANDAKLATKFEVEQQDVIDYTNPMLVAMDVDNDSVALFRYTGEYFLDFTEPTVLAAIAAAPCKRDIGQDSCSSSWGSSQTGALGQAFSVEVFGSYGFGVGATAVVAQTKKLATVGAFVRGETSRSYELTKSQTFTTGPFEDGVVFTAIPVDRYSYEAIKDTTVDRIAIGERIEIRLPRTPYLRIVERNYYNASISDESEPIDERVFTHTPGDVFTYPTDTDKNFILASNREIIEEFRFTSANTGPDTVLPAERGLEVGPVIVGEGGGSTELGLEYTETLGSATELGMSFTFESETTAGAAIKWNVGIEGSATLSVSHGDSTLFSGSVDSIAGDLYLDNLYSFGLFAYLQVLDNPDKPENRQEIEVINFWVEE